MPPGVTPPLGSLTPEGGRPGQGVTPEVPAVSVQSVASGQAPPGWAPLPPGRCIDPRYDPRLGGQPLADGSLPTISCPQSELQRLAGQRSMTALEAAVRSQVPVTQGRQGEPSSPWNTWVDARHLDINDRRDGQDLDGKSSVVAVGADRWVAEDTVAGVSVSVDSSRSDGFGGAWENASDGFSVSPYVAYRLSRDWALDASLIWRFGDNETDIATLEGDYDTESFGGAINAHGQYHWGEALLRPTVSVYYSHERSDDYDLSGNVFGAPVRVEVPGDSWNVGVATLSGEVSRLWTIDQENLVMPYLEAGVDWAFERPNDGRYLNADLQWEEPSDWTGTLRGGARWLMGEATLLEVSAGYLSLGHDDLDVWEGRLYLSYGF
ncbi:autotransporter domain-containing protein [Halomonas sp. V046]|uniref:autotransporter domain-containing protein n=1 Tax=Halomonas sp. V046 TaxID=3459611 RepID=UPI004044EF4C